MACYGGTPSYWRPSRKVQCPTQCHGAMVKMKSRENCSCKGLWDNQLLQWAKGSYLQQLSAFIEYIRNRDMRTLYSYNMSRGSWLDLWEKSLLQASYHERNKAFICQAKKPSNFHINFIGNLVCFFKKHLVKILFRVLLLQCWYDFISQPHTLIGSLSGLRENHKERVGDAGPCMTALSPTYMSIH